MKKMLTAIKMLGIMVLSTMGVLVAFIFISFTHDEDKAAAMRDLRTISDTEFARFYKAQEENLEKKRKEREAEEALILANGQKTSQELYFKSSNNDQTYEREEVCTLIALPQQESTFSQFGWMATVRLTNGDMLFVEATPGDHMAIGEDVVLYKQEIVIPGGVQLKEKLYRRFITPLTSETIEKIAKN